MKVIACDSANDLASPCAVVDGDKVIPNETTPIRIEAFPHRIKVINQENSTDLQRHFSLSLSLRGQVEPKHVSKMPLWHNGATVFSFNLSFMYMY